MTIWGPLSVQAAACFAHVCVFLSIPETPTFGWMQKAILV